MGGPGPALQASALAGSIKDICIQLDPSTGSGLSATAGAAIWLTPPSTTAYQTGWHIERNTILNPNLGIDVPGAGYSSDCCGVGTAVDSIVNQPEHNRQPS